MVWKGHSQVFEGKYPTQKHRDKICRVSVSSISVHKLQCDHWFSKCKIERTSHNYSSHSFPQRTLNTGWFLWLYNARHAKLLELGCLLVVSIQDKGDTIGLCITHHSNCRSRFSSTALLCHSWRARQQCQLPSRDDQMLPDHNEAIEISVLFLKSLYHFLTYGQEGHWQSQITGYCKPFI